MAINYGSIPSGTSIDTVTDPQKLFQALPAKNKKYGYLRDVQGDVLGKWNSQPKGRDTVIKMNTGGGKTTVGLLILKSSINEGFGPAVYLCPDYYLCTQVEAEAKSLGIPTTDDPRSYEYQSGKAILVIPIFKLINGYSVFGVGMEVKIPIGTIVIDDAHACLADAEGRFSISIPRTDQTYEALFALFSEDLKTQSPAGVEDIISGDPRAFLQVPYWAWKDKQQSVLSILASKLPDDQKKFVWPLLKEDIHLCRCYFNKDKLEISSRCLPIECIPSFDSAKRRIYMTATLSDDAILVTDFGADSEAIKNPITPKTASDIGERMILVPQEINTDVLDEDIKRFVAKYAAKENVVVIVPSAYRAKFWADVITPGMYLTAANIEAGVAQLRKSKGHLAVLLNKYDGIDLPDDACRLLVIDGLPDTRRLFDKYEQGTLRDSSRFNARQIQRIEQGMGRGIRSNEDYCAVILMGAQLLKILVPGGATQFFSPATKMQLWLSKKVASQVANMGLTALAEPIADVLNRNPGWVSAAKNALIEVAYPERADIDPIAIAQRRAYDTSRGGKYENSSQVLNDAAHATNDTAVKGWLLEQAAEAIHPIDKVRSQILLGAASDLNKRVTKPLAGISYKRISLSAVDQAQQSSEFLRSTYGNGGNAVVLGMNGLLDDLTFKEEGADAFEQAMMDLGLHLGFRSQRPEKDGAAKLDVLWSIGNNEYLLLPCKSEATANTISKHYCDQIGGNVNWFVATYDLTSKAVPVMVHPSTGLAPDATPPAEMRVLGREQLVALHAACRAFATAVKDRLGDASHVRASLLINGLTGNQFVSRFTVPPNNTKR